ncbi:hypothetical protein GCM10023340_14110 [Nocardioides marinquilinus]|uniref:Uncharacterized protein n=1 Tax=Nocardioides marinquilinus TaxID=1210400 RepID=A0ABP9PHH3_9ACTN
MRSLMGWMVGALLVGGVTMGAAPAHAEEYVNVDQAGDVRAHDLWGDGDMPSGYRPERRQADLVGYTVRYGLERVRVELRFRELDRRDPVLHLQARFAYLDDGELETGIVGVTADRRVPGGEPYFSPVGCDVMWHVGYQANKAWLSFSASCIGTPDWIQVNPVAFATDADTSYWFVDSRFPIYGPHGEKQFGKPVHRGVWPTPPAPPSRVRR